MVRKINNDRLGLGQRRGITVTVTTTPSSLATLLNAASAGRTELENRRQLNLQNTGAVTIYLLESASQTVTEGVQLLSTPGLNERYYECSTSMTVNDLDTEYGTEGTFFAVSSGTCTMVVEEVS